MRTFIFIFYADTAHLKINLCPSVLFCVLCVLFKHLQRIYYKPVSFLCKFYVYIVKESFQECF